MTSVILFSKILSIKEKHMKKGTLCIVIGVLLILAALGVACYNIIDENKANELSSSVLEQLAPEIIEATEEVMPNYQIFPDMEMPVKEIDGNDYIGVLEFLAFDMELPVMSDWSYPKLKTAPCRYSGSAYKNDMVICAHNYDCHFGVLKSMIPGEMITFTDMDGNEFLYEVAEIEVLDPYATEEMTSGDWDLTLFTCTYGGQERVTVRCIRSEYIY